MKKSSVLLFLGVFAIFSCKKASDPVPVDPPNPVELQPCRLQKITYGNYGKELFLYDMDGKLIKSTNSENGTVSRTQLFKYNNERLAVRKSSGWAPDTLKQNLVDSFFYDQKGRLTEVRYYNSNANGNKLWKTIYFEYDTDFDKPVRHVKLEDNKIDSFSLTWIDGNLVAYGGLTINYSHARNYLALTPIYPDNIYSFNKNMYTSINPTFQPPIANEYEVNAYLLPTKIKPFVGLEQTLIWACF